jgi:hypothetical protein
MKRGGDMSSPSEANDRGSRLLLRHTVATVAYRGGKALRGAPPGFSSFRASETSRTAGQILAHVVDLFEWALSKARGEEAWRDSAAGSWDEDTARFHGALAALDAYLASDAPLHASAEEIFQGPIADALTHVGQIALLRRLAQAPVRGENYARAEIVAGRTGPEQAAPRREFE